MRMPFERLMEYAAGLGEDDQKLSMGELAGRVGESAERLADAVDAVRVMAGERTYITVADVRAATDPVVRRALDEDRGGVVSGSAPAPWLARPGACCCSVRSAPRQPCRGGTAAGPGTGRR
jgi:hypothetical protein